MEDTWKVAEVIGYREDAEIHSVSVGRVYSGSPDETVRVKFRVMMDGEPSMFGPSVEMTVRQAELFGSLLRRASLGELSCEKVGTIEVRSAGRKFASGMKLVEMLRLEFDIYPYAGHRESVVVSANAEFYHAVQDVLYSNRG